MNSLIRLSTIIVKILIMKNLWHIYYFYVKTKILADFHICIFVVFNCRLNCLHGSSIHYLVFTSIQWYMYSEYLFAKTKSPMGNPFESWEIISKMLGTLTKKLPMFN